MQRIVVTGGTLSGKTDLVRRVSRLFPDVIIPVPEAAATLIDSGVVVVPKERPLLNGWVRDFQAKVFEKQLTLEKEAAFSAPDTSVLLCDRGLADGAAFWPEGVEDFFISLAGPYGLLRNDVLEKYSLVIHLMTPAYLGDEVFGRLKAERSEMRMRTVGEVRNIDLRLSSAWVGHSNLHIVEAQRVYEDKLASALSLVRKQLSGR